MVNNSVMSDITSSERSKERKKAEMDFWQRPLEKTPSVVRSLIDKMDQSEIDKMKKELEIEEVESKISELDQYRRTMNTAQSIELNNKKESSVSRASGADLSQAEGDPHMVVCD